MARIKERSFAYFATLRSQDGVGRLMSDLGLPDSFAGEEPSRLRLLETARAARAELSGLGRWSEANEAILDAIGSVTMRQQVIAKDLTDLVYTAGGRSSNGKECTVSVPIPGERRDAMRAMLMANQAVERDEAIEVARRVLDSTGAREGGTFWYAVLVLIYADELDLARAACARVAECPEWSELAEYRDLLEMVRVRIDWAAGESAAAHERIEELFSRGLYFHFTGLAVAWAARAKVDLGDVAGAEALMRRHDLFGSLAHMGDSVELLVARGAVHRAAGRLLAARDDFLAAGAELRSWSVVNSVMNGWRWQAAVCARETGREGLASVLAQKDLVVARRWGTKRGSGLALAAVGMVCEGENDLELLTAAAELLDGADTRRELMQVQYQLGMRLCVNKRYEDGLVRFAAALGIARGAGRRAWVTRLEQAMELWAENGGLRELTKQALRVASLAQAGFENREIATTLHLTNRTIEFHLSNVYRKLGISGRAGLASVPVPTF
ncbi:LuxR C-terminal-related transcriptional regulator [Amycolatopsis sp. cg5]|uniref:helix-turn-helix transcriptional regulator n=1 Tax=Amycolatopsis sp. cg5 TaxID=3238802 RepID=UPI003523B88C